MAGASGSIAIQRSNCPHIINQTITPMQTNAT